MRITDVQIEGFGVWSDLKLDRLADGLTVFYGPNEAGKTTLLQFIRSILYGYSAERRARYLPPVNGGRGGGLMGLVDTGGRFSVRRTPGNGLNSEDHGKVEVLSASGTRQGQHILSTMLCGIDEPIFNNVFAVGLRELQELGTLDDTEAAAQLYKLTSGLDRVSLVDVMRDLETARGQIVAPDAGSSQLLELVARRDKLRHEVKELAADGQRWAQLVTQRNELRDELARLEDSIERMEQEARAVEVSLQVRQDWFRRTEVRQRLEKLGPAVELPERAVERMEQYDAQIRECREEIDKIRRQRRVIVDEAAAQPINRQLWAHAGRVEAICEHTPWISSLENQIQHLDEEADDLEKQLKGNWEKLGLSPREMPELTPDVSTRTLNALRGPSRAVREAAERVEATGGEREAAEAEAEEIHQQLLVELADTGESELEQALETAGERVTLLRRRVKLESRLDKLDRHRKELEEDRRDLIEEQVLPVSTLVWCGVPFVLGVVMVLGSIFWDAVANLGWFFTVLGLACWVFAIVTKVILERSTTRELDACVRQLEKIKRQIRDLKEEREELDHKLPAGGGPLDVRVADAEAYVKKLEELTPLETKRQAVLARGRGTSEKTAQVNEALREAKAKWRDALRSVNLPESFQPEHIQQLSDGSDQTLHIARRLKSRREELQTREEELLTITGRVDQLLDEVKITAASDDPKTQLRQISAAMTEQRQWIERRKELKSQHRELKKQFQAVTKRLRQLLRQRSLLLHQACVEDEAELRKTAARQAKIEEFTAEHKQLCEHIRLAIGQQCSEQAVGEVLETHEADRLESYWERLVARLQESQGRLSQLHQSRGEMNQEMKTLADDRRLPKARLRLECAETQIREMIARWRVLAVTSLMLEAIRQIYETERQPETLSEASHYLEQLTEGRYCRVWTPLSEDVLRVDDAEGQSLAVDVLSQGTREAVFISLRLALSAAYSRRGAVLPMVLDDVLVNFDTRRAKSAARVLREFASAGHQMLLFTCHHHIMQIFEAADAEVRMLPIRNGLDQDESWRTPGLELEPEPVQEVFEPEMIVDEVADPEPLEVEEVVAEDEPAEEVVEEVEAEEEIPEEPEAEEAVCEEEPEPPVEDELHPALWDTVDDLSLALDDVEALDPWEAALLAAGNGHDGRWWEAGHDDEAA